MYADVGLDALPEAARKRLGELMATMAYEYKSDFAGRYMAQGEAKMMLVGLGARGMDDVFG